MSIHFYYYYLQTNLVCILILGYILWAYIKDGNKGVAASFYKAALIEVIVYCLSDILAACFRGETFPGARVILYIANTVYVSMPLILSFSWELYVKNRMKEYGYSEANISIFLRITVLVFFALSLLSPFSGFSFTLDENNIYQRNIGSYLVPLFCYAELFVVTGKLLLLGQKNDSEEVRKTAFSMASFLILPFSCSVIQVLAYGCSLTQVGFTLSFLFVSMNRLRKLGAQQNYSGEEVEEE